MLKCFNRNFLSVVFIVITATPFLIAQWVNNTDENVIVVTDIFKVKNLSAVEDGEGGVFVVWEDIKEAVNKIYFSHFNAEGKISLRADGKRVSVAGGPQTNSKVIYGNDKTVVILWRGIVNSGKNEIFIQKAASNGSLLWSERGLQLTNSKDEVSGFSIDVTDNADVLVTYVAKEQELTGDYKVMFRKINANGTIDTNKIVLHESNNRMGVTKISCDNENGAFVYWLENIEGKAVLIQQHIGLSDLSINEKPLIVSDAEKSVDSYSVSSFGLSTAYVCWQYEGSENVLYQSLITDMNESLWKPTPKVVEKENYAINDLKLFADEEKLWLCWSLDSADVHSVKVTSVDKSGNTIFTECESIEFKNSMLPQIISDGNGGAVVSFFVQSSGSVKPDIYAQRISSSGKMLWRNSGVAVTKKLSAEEKSLSLVPDNSSGAIFVFNDVKNDVPAFYAQRIFGTGTYVSQIVGFTAETISDSIKISWISANEKDSVYYVLEKFVPDDSTYSGWKTLDTIYANGFTNLSHYEYYDKPGAVGTIHYKLVLESKENQALFSEVASVNYITSGDKIIVAQNIPNPFSDSTMISFYLPGETDVSIEFFNSRIEKIHEFKKKKYKAGKHDLWFYIKGLEPGIYFYRFKAKEPSSKRRKYFIDVKKMVVAK